MAKRKSIDGKSKTLMQFSEAITDVLNEIAGETFESIDRGLDKAMDYLRDKLTEASPVESGLTRESWEGEDKYKNIRYINNTRLNDKGIPVVNLLEYGSRGKPFVRKTVVAEQEKIIEIIKGEVENGNTQ